MGETGNEQPRNNIVNLEAARNAGWLRIAPPTSEREYKQALAATLADLKRSSLDQDMATLGIIALTPKQVIELLNRHYAPRGDEFYKENLFDYYGYVIPYFDLDNRRLESHARLRILAPDEELLQYKVRKYVQFDPSSSGHDDEKRDRSPHFYLTPTVKWREIANDVSVELNFTEGEKKAAKACFSGVIYIALGGVDSFTAEEQADDNAAKKKLGRPKRGRNPPIKDFKLLRWKGRRVGVTYDAEENPKIRKF